MTVYHFADLALWSTLALPELRRHPPARSAATDIVFSVEGDLEKPRNEENWVHSRDPTTDQVVLSIATTATGFVLRFPGLADFEISARGDRIEAWPKAGISQPTIRHLLLDQVLPRVIAHRGRMVLHASAVAIGDSAIAFAGESGCGKSTLAASFDATGFEALADDAVIVTVGAGESSVQALYPGLRLWPSSVAALGRERDDISPMAQYSTKGRLPPAQRSASAARHLAALFLLTPASEILESTPVLATQTSARDTCMEIIRSTFHLDVADPERAAQLLDSVAELVTGVPVRTLSIPHDYSRLPEVHDVVLQSVAECGAASPVGGP